MHGLDVRRCLASKQCKCSELLSCVIVSSSQSVAVPNISAVSVVLLEFLKLFFGGYNEFFPLGSRQVRNRHSKSGSVGSLGVVALCQGFDLYDYIGKPAKAAIFSLAPLKG